MINNKIKNLRLLGIIMFFVGAIIAISAGAKMPASGSEYPDTLAIFAVGLAMGIIGNILWHRTEKAKVMAELEMHKNDETNNPLSLLKKTIPAIEKLVTISDSKKGMDLCHEVDNVLDTYVHPFTEKRKTFVDMLGMEKGSEVLLMIAYAERMLNRTWSASSDGHHPEAMSSLKDSLVNYKKALAKLP